MYTRFSFDLPLKRDTNTYVRMCIVEIGLFPIHMSTNHCSTEGALSKLIATAHAT